MDPTQALVAIWISVAAEHMQEFRKWHNCEHSTDRMDGPGFRAGYRYNAVDESAITTCSAPSRGIPWRVYERLLQGIAGQPKPVDTEVHGLHQKRGARGL